MELVELFLVRGSLFHPHSKKRDQTLIAFGAADCADEHSRGSGLRPTSIFRRENWLQRNADAHIRGDHDAGVNL